MRECLKREVDRVTPDENGIIYGLLCVYYDGEIFKGIEVSDVESEVYMPLAERPSGILEALEMLMPMESNINDENDWTALMMSVCNLDYYMSEYLINHGANPCYWVDREEHIKEHEILGIPMSNYYLEDIDIRLMDVHNLSEEKISRCILNLVKTILEFEGVESFFGLCLSADKENREISISSLRCKY